MHGRTAVSQQAVERALGKLLTDEAFRTRFFAAPGTACWEAGLPLSAVEPVAEARELVGRQPRLSGSRAGGERVMVAWGYLRARVSP